MVQLIIEAIGETVEIPLWVARQCTTLKDILDDCDDGDDMTIPIPAPTSIESPTIVDRKTIDWIVAFAVAAKTADKTAITTMRTRTEQRDADVQMTIFDDLDKEDAANDAAYAADHDGEPPAGPHQALLRMMTATNYLNYKRAKRAAVRRSAILIEKLTENTSTSQGAASIRAALMPYVMPPRTDDSDTDGESVSAEAAISSGPRYMSYARIRSLHTDSDGIAVACYEHPNGYWIVPDPENEALAADVDFHLKPANTDDRRFLLSKRMVKLSQADFANPANWHLR